MSEPITSDLHQLNLHSRTYSSLRRSRVHTIADLLRMGRALVSGLYLIGPFALYDIAKGLEAAGLCWTVEGAPPLPGLPSAAAQMVEVLGLDDSLAVRQGLARVLRAAVDWDSVGVNPLVIATDLEQGAQ